MGGVGSIRSRRRQGRSEICCLYPELESETAIEDQFQHPENQCMGCLQQSAESKRQADAYILALLANQDKATINPL